MKLRRSKGITQKQVAEALGVTERTVSYWESGKHPPRLSLPQIKALCRLLELPIEDLPDDLGPELN